MADKIKLTIEGDSTSLKAATDSASLSISDLSSKSRDSINSFAKWGAAGTAAGVAIIAGVVNSSRQSIDSLAKTSDKLGITTEALTAMRHAGELTGVSSNTMDMALQRMTRRLAEAAQGTGEAQTAIKELGLDAEQLAAMSPDESFKKISESMKDVTNQGDKVRLAMRFFDSEGVALVNTLGLTSEELQQVEEDTMAFGTAISRVDAAKVEMANDSFEKVQESMKGVATQLTVQLAPVMKVVADRFVDAARESGGFTDVLLAGINASIEAVAFLADVVRGLEVAWQVAEVAAMGFISLTLTGLDELAKAGAAALDWIPGVDVTPSTALSEWAEESRQALIMTNAELSELVDKPMPGDNIKQFFADVTQEAQSAAEEIAESKAQIISPDVEGDSLTAKEEEAAQKTISIHEAKYQKLREMAEEFQLSEAEREVLRVERENEQFELDLETMIENGVVEDEALALQRQARLDAEAIHQDNMLNIMGIASKQGQYNAQADAESTLAIVATQNEKAFKLQKAVALAKATASLPSSVMQSFEQGGGYPTGLIPAGLMAVRGAAEIASINAAKYSGQAHSGLDRNPEEGTMLLRRDEMVLDPGTSKEVREAAKGAAEGGGGGVNIENLNITVEAVTADGETDWDKTAEENIAPAIDRLFRRDIFLEGVVYG